MNNILYKVLISSDCLCLPGLGEFTLYRQPNYNLKTNRTTEITNSILFNQKAKLNNGSLAQYLMKKDQNISLDEAMKQINTFVEEVWIELKFKGEFLIPRIGLLTLNEKGELVFQQNVNRQEEAKTETTKDALFYKKVIAVVVVFLFFSTAAMAFSYYYQHKVEKALEQKTALNALK